MSYHVAGKNRAWYVLDGDGIKVSGPYGTKQAALEYCNMHQHIDDKLREGK